MLFRDLATLRTNIPVFDSVDQLEWHCTKPAFQAWKTRFDSATEEQAPNAPRR